MECIPEAVFLPLIAWDLPARAVGVYGEHIDGCSRCAARVREAMARAPGLGLDPAPPVCFDDFELLRPLGRGTTGRLYLARDRQLGRLVALKFLIVDRMGEATCERLMTEARALARLQHPNVVAVFRVGEVAGRRYLAYEYVAGRSLERAGPMTWPELLHLGLGMARGLAAAHQRGVLHRDLKPGNVLYSGAGEVKLVDFGLAKLVADGPGVRVGDGHAPRVEDGHDARVGDGHAPRVEDGHDARVEDGHGARVADGHGARVEDGPSGPASLADADELASTLPLDASSTAAGMTGAGRLVGTPVYMAPEAWQGAPAAAPRDVYGLGLILHELAAGPLPHATLSLVAMCRHVLANPPPSLRVRCPELPAGLAALIDRCVLRDPSARPGVDELVAGFEALAGLAVYGGLRASEPLAADDAGQVAASLAALGGPTALVPGFYARLFADHPFLRPLFPHDMDGQHAKLAAALHLVVANLKQPAALRPTLVELGRRHRGYGATRGHYTAVRAALLGAVADRLADALTPAVAAAWGRALDLLVATMLSEETG